MKQEKHRKGANQGTRTGALAACTGAVLAALPLPAAAASNDPYSTVNNAIDFLMQLLTGVGICFIAFGVISLAISFQSHDDSQKSKAIMAIVGGAIAVSVRFVITTVTGSPDLHVG